MKDLTFTWLAYIPSFISCMRVKFASLLLTTRGNLNEESYLSCLISFYIQKDARGSPIHFTRYLFSFHSLFRNAFPLLLFQLVFSVPLYIKSSSFGWKKLTKQPCEQQSERDNNLTARSVCLFALAILVSVIYFKVHPSYQVTFPFSSMFAIFCFRNQTDIIISLVRHVTCVMSLSLFHLEGNDIPPTSPP